VKANQVLTDASKYDNW
jgi:preprotein translocase subunit Sec63